MPSLEALITQYGYVALFVGTFLEGETILVLGGLAAQQGLLSLPWVIAVAFLGSLAGDQTAFLIGRRWGPAVIARFPTWQGKIEKIQQKASRYLDLWMLTFRFFYGLRNPTPFVLAASGVPLARFAVLNALGALVWALAGGAGGYLFGHALERALGEVRQYILVLVGAALGLWLLVALVRRRRRGGRDQDPGPAA